MGLFFFLYNDPTNWKQCHFYDLDNFVDEFEQFNLEKFNFEKSNFEKIQF